VPAVFTIVTVLIGIVPLLTLNDGAVVEAFILAITAVAITLIAVNIRAVDLVRLGGLLGFSAVIAVLPGIWMVLQVLPISGLAHPIWTSAAAALDKTLVGAVSIDIGATLLAFARYCGIIAIAIATTAVALERQRAERIFLVLIGVAALVAGELILFKFGYLNIAGFEFSAKLAAAQGTCVLGLILSCASAISAYEHYDRRRRNGESKVKTAGAITASTVVVVLCSTAIVLNADVVVLFSAVFGVGTMMAIWAIRQLRLRSWGISGIAAVAVLCTTVLLVSSPSIKDADATLALSNQSQASIAATARMLSDVRWTGIGAGCFSALLPVYRDVDDPTANGAPTTAALIAIELGRPALWVLVILALVAALYFFRAALQRGRDYVYSATGAGSILAILILSFSNSGTIEPAASLLASIIFGLALAQSRSWSS
jgi:hypothetical protein